MPNPISRLPRFIKAGILFALAAGCLFLLFLFLKSIPTRSLVSRPSPSASYEESLRRIESLSAWDGPEVSPDGKSVLLTHGMRTEHVVVLFHGSTNSPRQFRELGDRFYTAGYNVLIPRIPHHGLKDRMTGDHALLTAEELTRLCDESVDIAQGLGKKVSVMGLSLGGNMASWVAQNRRDVDRAVIIAPFWGWKEVPAHFWKPSINLLAVLPNMFIWWDKEEKMAFRGPTSAYYRFSTRGLAQIMRLGWCVLEEAKTSSPRARSIVVVTNDLDQAVNGDNIETVTRAWERTAGARVERFVFDESYGVGHDLIDPEQPDQKIEKVYPKLMELMAR